MHFRSVLSLFDGISGAQVALSRSKHSYGKYYASEIDTHAIKVTNSNFPNTFQLGDIKQISKKSLPNDIDLIIGGSPCQSFSFAGKELGFEDERGQLLLEYVRILKEVCPLYFILENVKMKIEFENTITKLLGVEPVKINSSLVSAQNRNRLYWTNIESVPQPEDKKIFLFDVLESSNMPERYYNTFKPNKTPSRDLMWYGGKCKKLYPNVKTWAVTTKQDRWNNAGLVGYQDYFRFLTPLECERLQTFPDNYTSILSNTQRYRCIGNSFTVDVITHILNCI